MSEKKETYKLFNLPWYYFAIFAVVVLIATYTGNLPKGMSGCFAFMIVLGTILYEIGEKRPSSAPTSAAARSSFCSVRRF